MTFRLALLSFKIVTRDLYVLYLKREKAEWIFLLSAVIKFKLNYVRCKYEFGDS